jgi:hypothetical protein
MSPHRLTPMLVPKVQVRERPIFNGRMQEGKDLGEGETDCSSAGEVLESGEVEVLKVGIVAVNTSKTSDCGYIQVGYSTREEWDLNHVEAANIEVRKFRPGAEVEVHVLAREFSKAVNGRPFDVRSRLD